MLRELESELSGLSFSAVARKHGVSPSLLFTWRRLAREVKLSAIKAGEEVVAASEVPVCGSMHILSSVASETA